MKSKEHSKFLLRFAMETYGLKIMLYNDMSTMSIATTVLDKISRACRQQDAGEVDKVGCSMGLLEQIGGFHEYNIYIHFSMPPVPSVAISMIGECFKDIDVTTLELISPFSKPACGLKDSSHALAVIKENQSNIMNNVTSGRNFYLVKKDHPKYGM